jgi:hypothetical protein
MRRVKQAASSVAGLATSATSATSSSPSTVARMSIVAGGRRLLDAAGDAAERVGHWIDDGDLAGAGIYAGGAGGVGFEMGFGAGGAGEWAERVEQERLAAQEREEAHRRQLQRWEAAAEEVRLQIIERRAAHRRQQQQQQQQARSAAAAGATAAPPRSAPAVGRGAGWAQAAWEGGCLRSCWSGRRGRGRGRQKPSLAAAVSAFRRALGYREGMADAVVLERALHELGLRVPRSAGAGAKASVLLAELGGLLPPPPPRRRPGASQLQWPAPRALGLELRPPPDLRGAEARRAMGRRSSSSSSSSRDAAEPPMMAPPPPPPPKTTVPGTPARGQERPQEAEQQEAAAEAEQQAAAEAAAEQEEMLRLTVPEVLECLHVSEEENKLTPAVVCRACNAPPRPARRCVALRRRCKMAMVHCVHDGLYWVYGRMIT